MIRELDCSDSETGRKKLKITEMEDRNLSELPLNIRNQLITVWNINKIWEDLATIMGFDDKVIQVL